MDKLAENLKSIIAKENLGKVRSRNLHKSFKQLIFHDIRKAMDVNFSLTWNGFLPFDSTAVPLQSPI